MWKPLNAGGSKAGATLVPLGVSRVDPGALTWISSAKCMNQGSSTRVIFYGVMGAGACPPWVHQMVPSPWQKRKPHWFYVADLTFHFIFRWQNDFENRPQVRFHPPPAGQDGVSIPGCPAKFVWFVCAHSDRVGVMFTRDSPALFWLQWAACSSYTCSTCSSIDLLICTDWGSIVDCRGGPSFWCWGTWTDPKIHSARGDLW